MSSNFIKLSIKLGLISPNDTKGVCLGLAQEFTSYYMRGDDAFRRWLRLHSFIKSLGRSGNMSLDVLITIMDATRKLQISRKIDLYKEENQREVLLHLNSVHGLASYFSRLKMSDAEMLQLVNNSLHVESFLHGVVLAQFGYRHQYKELFSSSFSTKQGVSANALWNADQPLYDLVNHVRVDKKSSFKNLLKQIHENAGDVPVVYRCYFVGHATALLYDKIKKSWLVMNHDVCQHFSENDIFDKLMLKNSQIIFSPAYSSKTIAGSSLYVFGVVCQSKDSKKLSRLAVDLETPALFWNKQRTPLEFFSIATKEDVSPIFLAIFRQDQRLVRYLLNVSAYTADERLQLRRILSKVRWHNNTALEIACKYANYEATDLLLQAGAVLSIKSLEFALRSQDQNILSLLLRDNRSAMEAIIRKKNKDSVLIVLCNKGDATAISSFIAQYRTTIDYQNALGNTALMSAARRGDIDMVKTLLDNNADSRLINNDKKDAFAIAFEHSDHKMLSLLDDSYKCIYDEKTELKKFFSTTCRNAFDYKMALSDASESLIEKHRLASYRLPHWLLISSIYGMSAHMMWESPAFSKAIFTDYRTTLLQAVLASKDFPMREGRYLLLTAFSEQSLLSNRSSLSSHDLELFFSALPDKYRNDHLLMWYISLQSEDVAKAIRSLYNACKRPLPMGVMSKKVMYGVDMYKSFFADERFIWCYANYLDYLKYPVPKSIVVLLSHLHQDDDCDCFATPSALRDFYLKGKGPKYEGP